MLIETAEIDLRLYESTGNEEIKGYADMYIQMIKDDSIEKHMYWACIDYANKYNMNKDYVHNEMGFGYKGMTEEQIDEKIKRSIEAGIEFEKKYKDYKDKWEIDEE